MSLSHEQDANLLARIALGDEEAFRELYLQYKKKIDGFIRPRADSREDVEDIAQDTWLKLRINASKYDSSRGAVSTFLRMIATTAIIDFYRRNSNRATILFTEMGGAELGDGEAIEIGDLLYKLTPNAIRSAPEGMNLLLEDLMLRLVFEGSSPPHQMIVFGLVERLGWRPRQIISELSPRILRVLEEKLETDYAATSELSDATIRAHFGLLRNNMARPLMEVLTEPKTKEICKDFLDSKTGETSLNQYFTHNPAEEVALWCFAVRRRVAGEIVHRSLQKGTNVAPLGCENPG
jgi:RNA polymerase sigma factor (sigma-70 family)